MCGVFISVPTKSLIFIHNFLIESFGFETMASSVGKVELRPLGNTGLKLSCVGFGASPLGNVFGPVSEDDAISSVHQAFRLGINFFDTSPYVLLNNSYVQSNGVKFSPIEQFNLKQKNKKN